MWKKLPTRNGLFLPKHVLVSTNCWLVDLEVCGVSNGAEMPLCSRVVLCCVDPGNMDGRHVEAEVTAALCRTGSGQVFLSAEKQLSLSGL